MIDRQTVLELLIYDSTNGTFIWKPRDIRFFVGDSSYRNRACKIWNIRFAGKAALKTLRKGYLSGCIFGKNYATHQIVWLIETGEFVSEIDHVKGVKTDNRFSELRAVTHTENCRNRVLHRTNTSGVSGVNWVERDAKWHARIGVLNTRITLGYFDSFKDAVAARKSAEILHSYHENHGRRQEERAKS